MDTIEFINTKRIKTDSKNIAISIKGFSLAIFNSPP